MDQKQHETSKCERKVVRRCALETKKLIYSLQTWVAVQSMIGENQQLVTNEPVEFEK